MQRNRIAITILCAACACATSMAADAVAAGKEPVALHAQQTELQDKIDLLQLRIETMAVRWNMDIPQPPKPGSAEMDEGAMSEKRIDTAFVTGRERTDRALVERCRQVLSTIDYETFLSRPL